MNNINSHILEMYSEAKENFVNHPDYMINFYTRNRSSIEAITKFRDRSEIQAFIEIVSNYLKALFEKGRFNDVVDFADKKMTLINPELQRLRSEDLKDHWYNRVLHYKGMAAYRLRDYKTSTQIYKYLSQAEPKNENFKEWRNYSSYRQKKWLVKTINIACLLLALTYFLTKKYIPFFEVRISLISIAALGLLINSGYEYYITRNFRRTVLQHGPNGNGL